MARSGACETTRWKLSDGLPTWKMLVRMEWERAFGNDGNDRGQSSAEVPIGTG
jgi:hypothetical protein